MSVTTDNRLLQFLLRRPSKGVLCFSALGTSFLAQKEPWSSRTYDPRVESPHLLEDFAQLPADPDAYARFATQWGLLGLARLVSVVEDKSAPDELPNYAECCADWERIVLEIRTVAELHGALDARDGRELRRQVALEDKWLGFAPKTLE